MAVDVSLEVEILPDGRIKVTTPGIPGPLHLQAEQLFTVLESLTGAPVTRKRRADVARVEHGHSHSRDVDHSH